MKETIAFTSSALTLDNSDDILVRLAEFLVACQQRIKLMACLSYPLHGCYTFYSRRCFWLIFGPSIVIDRFPNRHLPKNNIFETPLPVC